ncbi:uncharacterized protein E0L32_002839 [Thyridium curvatum]|uniref:CENP-V/GFA domain-containing protein n=1 Tax=Thyridium curvatum TaxID=1093900 RepID=A0A507BLZ4_9PEZI|nr:uncharacterized protein E0L32_002839 [Thyridium curvatum]TPX17738.1 hypothetical protein E0L32_002839 [Thyridium curvatum]
MSTNEDFPKPKFIEGGCLCGGLRYRVDFDVDKHDFLKRSGSCQCTQCRRQTGSFFMPWHGVGPASTGSTFRFVGDRTDDLLRHYKASATGKRGFCAGCGSQIYWTQEGRSGGDYYSINLGTVDPLYLWGEGAGEGNDVPEGGYSKALAAGGKNEWCGNEIKGVTDDMPWLLKGKRFRGDENDA